MKIPKKTLLQLYVRSFFVQALWNYKSLISLGFCFSLLPVREKLKQTSEAYKNFITDQIQFFNSHPYFASYALGVMYRLYEEGPYSESKLEKIKNLLISPLGALGDKLFWNMIKPTAMLLAVLGGILWYLGYPGQWIMIIAFVIYNVPHLLLRWVGLVEGYKNGVMIYQNLNFESHKKLYKLYLNLGRALVIITFCVIIGLTYKYFQIRGLLIFLNIPLALFIHLFEKHIFITYGFIFIVNVIIGSLII